MQKRWETEVAAAKSRLDCHFESIKQKQANVKTLRYQLSELISTIAEKTKERDQLNGQSEE